MFDIEVKFALGLRLDERPFDHSSLGDFRERLLKSGKEKEVFDHILKQLIGSGLIQKDEVQRIDATHVIADIAIPSMTTFVKKGIFEVLKVLKVKRPNIYKEIATKIQIEEYQPDTVNHDAIGRFSVENRERKLVDMVRDAKIVLEDLDIASEPLVQEQVKILKTILRQNIIEDEFGNATECDKKKKPPDLLVSPVDPDARYGAKSITKRFMGYKANITQEVKNYFITNIEPTPGNKRDGEPTVDLIKAQAPLGIIPKKLIGDSAYGDGIWRNQLENHGTKLVAPFKAKNPRTKAVFPKSAFKINREDKTLTCPKGVVAKPHFYESEKGSMSFHFPMSACNKCEWQKQCTNAKEGRRTVRIFDWQEATYESERYNLTDEFRSDMKLRQPIEGKFSEMKRYHGLTRAKFRGIKKFGLQCYFTASAVNIKRWLNLGIENSLIGAAS